MRLASFVSNMAREMDDIAQTACALRRIYPDGLPNAQRHRLLIQYALDEVGYGWRGRATIMAHYQGDPPDDYARYYNEVVIGYFGEKRTPLPEEIALLADKLRSMVDVVQARDQ